MKIGHRIKVVRMRKRMTQKELADLIGVSHSTISRIEADEGTLTIQRLSQIAAELRIPLKRLIGD